VRRLTPLLAVVALLAAAPPAGAISGPATITISDREISRARVDLGRRGASAGDVETMRALLFNKRITRRTIGHSETVCVATGGGSSTCTETFFLPKGKIVAIAPVRFAEVFDAAVVGGTGLYANVRGTLTVTSLGQTPRRSLLVFRLVP
jgi:hypothetical protein